MDGVLFDSIEAIIAYQMMKYPTLTREEYLDALMGNDLDSFSTHHTAINRTPEKIALDQEAYGDTKSKSTIHAGIGDLLEKLYDQGYKIVLNTNAYDRFTVPLLTNSHIIQFFDSVMTRNTSESKIEKFKLVLEKYNVSPDQVLFVTDTVSDVRDANSVGIATIGVTWGVHTREYFYREPLANLLETVDSVKELENVIMSNLVVL